MADVGMVVSVGFGCPGVEGLGHPGAGSVLVGHEMVDRCFLVLGRPDALVWVSLFTIESLSDLVGYLGHPGVPGCR